MAMNDRPPPLPPQPQSLNYGGNALAGAAFVGRRRFSALRFVMTSAVMLVLLGILVFVMPRLERNYRDLGTELPAVTVVMLGIARAMSTPAGWIVGLLVTFGLAVLVGLLPLGVRGIRLLLVLILGLIVVAVALAVLLPIVNLMDSITSNPGKL
jgi:type II secretory pathway component PulF